MKLYFISLTSSYLHRYGRASSLATALVVLLCFLAGCDPLGLNDPIDKAVNEIENTRKTIRDESVGWRDELPKLVNDLSGIESQTSGDAKEIVADTTNQVHDLTTQTAEFSDAKAQDLIAQAGSEFRCNGAFVHDGAVAELQAIEDDLKFWKQYKTHQSKKPNHSVCWINPSALSLYPSKNGWSIDTNNMSEKNIVHVFGYNFWSEQLPTLQLQDANGTAVRTINLKAAYVTHYQINLDFSTEDFSDVKSGERLVFNWPDLPDPNTISLILNAPEKLKISDPVFSPPSPVVLKDEVSLKVTITNQGGSPIQDFVVIWQPDPSDGKVFSASAPHGLKPGESRDFSLGPYLYKRDGPIESVVSLNTGDDILHYSLNVLSNPMLSNPSPAITKLVLTFHTLDDDKDDSAAVHVEIYANDLVFSGDFGKGETWHDHTDKIIDNILLSRRVLFNEVPNMTIEIAQTGDDTGWNMSYEIKAVLDDGTTHVVAASKRIEIGDGHPLNVGPVPFRIE